MAGLIYKDIMVMKKTLVLYAFISVLYGYMEITTNSSGIMFAMVMLASTMVPISSIAYDERCGWDRVVNTCPLSRSQVIIAKYLLGLVLTAISAVVVFAIYLFHPHMTVTENIGTVAVMSLMALVYQALLLPTIIKFGSEKGRMIMMVILFAPVVLIFAIPKLPFIDLSALADMLERNSNILPFITVAVIAAVYICSVALSVKIYKNKDL
ncbi:MAG: ABC-2 transporter permease [Oscillospiraceae bacterium]|nr:ABC-2 transporter permease [Oscillospiraceae bacterium]